MTLVEHRCDRSTSPLHTEFREHIIRHTGRTYTLATRTYTQAAATYDIGRHLVRYSQCMAGCNSAWAGVQNGPQATLKPSDRRRCRRYHRSDKTSGMRDMSHSTSTSAREAESLTEIAAPNADNEPHIGSGLLRSMLGRRGTLREARGSGGSRTERWRNTHTLES